MLLAAIVLMSAVVGLLFKDRIYRGFFRPTDTSLSEGIVEVADENARVIAKDLFVPWGIVQLPEGDVLLTERNGTLRRIGKDNVSIPISGVAHQGEGGLLGVALDPDFTQNKRVYLYMTTQNGDGLTNRVERYTLQSDTLDDRTVLIDAIPGAAYHDGGQIAFGPDGMLYITTGDAGNPELSQDTSSLAGKILRITRDGNIPDDNPFDNPVYSYGHRNPQGLAWDNRGVLWSTEHGPSGAESGNDELNKIVKAGNYGWPKIRGQEAAEGMIRPELESGRDETWAPGAITYSQNSLFFTGLRGQALYEAKLVDGEVEELRVHLRNQYGRLRAITTANNDSLLLTTSNRDGRGEQATDDDKLILLSRELFAQ